MNILKLKAKVIFMSEEQMEVDSTYDLGNIASSKEWVWKQIAIPVEEVYKVISYSSSKSVVQLYDGEKILVNETFEDLTTRWESLRTVDFSEPETSEEEEEES